MLRLHPTNFGNCIAGNSMEDFHAIECLTCQSAITWSAFQVIASFTNHPWYYYLPISKLLQGCIFHAVTGRRWDTLYFLMDAGVKMSCSTYMHRMVPSSVPACFSFINLPPSRTCMCCLSRVSRKKSSLLRANRATCPAFTRNPKTNLVLMFIGSNKAKA